MGLGISGQIAKKFLQTEITPLLALVGFLLGVFAVIITPREEEPQIDVTFANVFIPFPGATANEVEQLVSTPAEQVLSEISGLKHIYSVSRPGMAVLTVQYKVGEERSQAIVRLYNKIFSNQDWLPQNLGVGQPIVKPMGIDDVPIVSITLWTEDDKKGVYDLTQVAHSIEAEIKRVPETRNVYTIGTTERVVHVLIDPQRLAAYDIAVDDLRQSLMASNQSQDAGYVVGGNQEIAVTAGQFLANTDEVARLIIGMKNDHPVYLDDVATVRQGPDQSESYVTMGTGPGAAHLGIQSKGDFPAVTIAVSKKPGSNAVQIAENVGKRMQQLEGIFIPDEVKYSITRDYGKTADAKAKKLISKLMFATAVVVALIWWFLGRREAFIVGVAIAITLAITLFASWAWGFTLNRVSLFALIFSIGILVDDAIVVVENIHRHMAKGDVNLVEAIPLAVDEVGGPTILATLTVIAALLPMAFVTGLMGPYMSPIPINASMGMLISLAVAFIITPWLSLKVLRTADVHHEEDSDKSEKFFTKIMQPFLYGEQQKRNRRWLTFGVLFLILASVSLALTKSVVLKMLPFDNKSEFQIIVDMPEGTTLEQTKRVLDELAAQLKNVEEVSDYQVYVGTAAPINFNGLVRQYYLRKGANVADIQVNLVDKSLRERKSHDVALSLREPLQQIGRQYNANVKVVEVPPGPPVMSPLVAEVYGPDYQGQIEHAKKIGEVFKSTPDIIDVDDSVEYPGQRNIVVVDRNRAAMMGVSQQAIANTLTTLLRGEDMGFLHSGDAKYAVPIRVELPVADKASLEQMLSVKVRSMNGGLVPLMDMVSIEESTRQYSIHHKDLLPVVYVTGDMAGELDSPLYGMFDMISALSEKMGLYFFNQPENPYEFSMKWDGEWTVTYETFRDMGIAYSVGLLMIYLLVVAQFRSYLVPLIIMAPIPLTIIGVMPGHALMGAQYTATSMIGMIALAGIIVRNSILLVDFINEQLKEGVEFQKAVIMASAVRAKPIILTGVAAMLGAVFILDDPIFSGLAVSLIFGILISTMLTLVVIPVMYYSLMHKRIG